MPKAPRHRKKVRSARTAANVGPLGGNADEVDRAAADAPKKVGKKEAEVTNLLEKLRSQEVDERVWASVRPALSLSWCRTVAAYTFCVRRLQAALSGMLLTLPPVTLRLLLSKNLIGLLIERLSDSSDSVVVESLGALRNLAVTSPLSLISEMHNKRILLPLTTTHLPLLATMLPSMLGPAPAPITAPLPSTPAQREDAQVENEKVEHRRRLYWDWTENVVFILWSLAESNTKILASLNAIGEDLVVFLGRLVASEGGDAGEMDVEAKKRKGKKAAANKSVPIGVALAAGTPAFCLVSVFSGS
ncbi:hypothetical protein P7C70_g5779, partial [Phenoliferia sp. Uapishka_3]